LDRNAILQISPVQSPSNHRAALVEIEAEGEEMSDQANNAIRPVVWVAAVIAMLAGPVYAQDKSKTLEEMMDAKTPDQIEKERAADRAYKESLKKIPDAKAPADPWGNARSPDALKPATKAKPKS
jgi:hypothetical protein